MSFPDNKKMPLGGSGDSTRGALKGEKNGRMYMRTEGSRHRPKLVMKNYCFWGASRAFGGIGRGWYKGHHALTQNCGKDSQFYRPL